MVDTTTSVPINGNIKSNLDDYIMLKPSSSILRVLVRTSMHGYDVPVPAFSRVTLKV
jgi:hypothetical protein